MPEHDARAIGTRSTRIPPTKVALTSVIALLALATSAPTGLQAAQLPSGGGAGQIRVSSRTASNRIWFQTGSVFTCRAETQSGCLDPAGPTKLEVVAANGVTLREFIGFAYMNDKGALTRSQVIGGPDWADTARFDLIIPMPGNSPAGLTRAGSRQDRPDGKYDYTLSFVPALLTAPNPKDPDVPNPAAGTGPSLAQAFEQRLGVKLVEAKDTFDVVVIDSVQPLQ